MRTYSARQLAKRQARALAHAEEQAALARIREREQWAVVVTTLAHDTGERSGVLTPFAHAWLQVAA